MVEDNGGEIKKISPRELSVFWDIFAPAFIGAAIIVKPNIILFGLGIAGALFFLVREAYFADQGREWKTSYLILGGILVMNVVMSFLFWGMYPPDILSVALSIGIGVYALVKAFQSQN